nr:hypothetical protein [Tanacetum cinerariifolium]
MGLFSFIHHVNPTKVIVGKIEKAGDQVSLLEATHGRVVPLALLVPVTAASSEGDMTENIDMLFDEGNSVEKAYSTGGGEYVVLTEAIVEPMNEDAAEKPRRLQKKAIKDASGSTLPPEKLRDDYGTSCASASTGGKSHAVMQNLLDSSKLDAEIRVTATATVPLITSFVTPSPKREGGDLANSVSGPNLRTKPAAVRFVISSDLSYHSGTHVVDVEVSSLIRSNISDPSVMTAIVATTAVGTSLVSLSKVTVKPMNHTLFGYSMSTSRDDVARPLIPIHLELFADSFYAIQDLNPEILHRVYVTKWTVTNEFVLDDPYICHTLTDQLAPPTIFSQARDIEYDQLYTKFNVGAAHHTCLGFEEVKAAEAIRLHGRVAIVEAAKAMHAAELNLLKERNSTLEAKMRAFEAKDMALKSKKWPYRSVAGYEIFKEQIEAVQDEQVRVHTEKIAKVDASLMGMALQLDDDFYMRYLTTIKGKRWILSLNKGMQDGLADGIQHEKVGWALSDVVAHNPSADANYVAAVSALRNGPAAEILGAGKLQPSHEQLMLPIHRPEENVVLGETSLSFSLEVIHNRIQRIRGMQTHDAYLFLMLWFHS